MHYPINYAALAFSLETLNEGVSNCSSRRLDGIEFIYVGPAGR
jgi:hypothetical protein